MFSRMADISVNRFPLCGQYDLLLNPFLDMKLFSDEQVEAKDLRWARLLRKGFPFLVAVDMRDIMLELSLSSSSSRSGFSWTLELMLR